ncbi:MAG: SEC-C domain-containing protein [Myxococcaceae bacterium]
MPRAERNAPCPCGSGKKYKKCHLEHDLAAEKQRPADQAGLLPKLGPAPAAEPAAPPRQHPPRREPTEHEKRWNALFEQLKTASADKMLELGRAYVESESEFDEEDAFALAVEFLEPALEEAGRAAELRPFIELIRQRHPEAYEANLGYFAERALCAAYEAGQDPEPHLLEWARTPTRQFDYFLKAVEQALFHGRERLALQALRVGKPALLDDGEIFDSAKRELARLAVEAALAASTADQELPAAIALSDAFGVFSAEHLAERLAHARRAVPLRLDELSPAAGPQPLCWQLYLLSADFARWLMGRRGWSAGRAALAQLGFDLLLTSRVEAFIDKARHGEFEEDFDEEGLAQPIWRGKPPSIGSLVGLDEKNLSRHLSGQLGMFGTGAYRASAVVLALPNWRPYLLEVGGDRGQLADPARGWSPRRGARRCCTWRGISMAPPDGPSAPGVPRRVRDPLTCRRRAPESQLIPPTHEQVLASQVVFVGQLPPQSGRHTHWLVSGSQVCVVGQVQTPVPFTQ